MANIGSCLGKVLDFQLTISLNLSDGRRVAEYEGKRNVNDMLAFIQKHV